MKLQNYKYKVAFSFATQDSEIAQAISEELDRLQIKNYLYTNENNAGKDLKKKTWKVYQEQSMYVLMLISKHYVQKKWADEERQIMQTVHRPENIPYIIPLRLDDTLVEGLSNNIAYLEWDGNPSYLAISLHQLIFDNEDVKVSESKREDKVKRPLNNFVKTETVNIDQRGN